MPDESKPGDARSDAGSHGEATADLEYAERLRRLDASRWRRVLNVQAPYRWNIRRLDLGRTLDIGCGLGRMLAHLGGNGVGVDHNPHSIATARARGLEAYVPDDFLASANAVPGSFDSLLMAHVLEHVDREAGIELIKSYLGFVRPGGKVCLITPQERGYRSDPTHVRFVDVEELESIAGELGLTGTRSYSFPFPRFAGRSFTYNEFVFVARVPERAA